MHTAPSGQALSSAPSTSCLVLRAPSVQFVPGSRVRGVVRGACMLAVRQPRVGGVATAVSGACGGAGAGGGCCCSSFSSQVERWRFSAGLPAWVPCRACVPIGGACVHPRLG